MAWTRHGPQLVLVFGKDTLTALRVNGSHEPLLVPLAVDPLADEPAVVAQELRERLTPLGRLPRRVVVGVPLSCVLAATVPVPEMPATEVPGYLRLQAEREFMLPPDGMWLADSAAGGSPGARQALLAALPARQAANLERSLRLAGFREVRIVPAAGAAAVAVSSVVRLLADDDGVDLVASAGGALVLLRRLAAGGGDPLASAAALTALVSDLRISLRQLPDGLGAPPTLLEVLGAAESVDRLAGALRAALPAGAWTVQALPVEHSVPSFLCVQMAQCLAAGPEPALVLAPLPVQRGLHSLAGWRRPFALAGAVVAALLVLGGGLALHQSHQLRQLRNAWQSVSPRVETVRRVMDNARSRQAWFSDQPVTLDLLRAITLAFPERGVVWATRLEISGRSQATVAGNATRREDWLKTLDALRQTAGISNLRVTQARESPDGKSPMTFALSFTYADPAARQNDPGGAP